MHFEIHPVTAFQQNCSLVVCPITQRAAFVDPGGDIDHCGQAGLLARQLGVPIEGPHQEDQFWIDQLKTQGMMFGMAGAEAFTPDRWLVDGDTVSVGQETMRVIHCPGHTPGHVVFVNEADRLAFVGDVLFAGSIGRTDFPRGNHQQLIDSIRGKLFPLGDDIEFVPGHGPMSTFGEERRSNPFVGE